MDNEVLIPSESEIAKTEKAAIRQNILDFESELSKVEGAFYGNTDNCPLRHTFADKIYVREIFLPKGVLVVGRIHKHSHPNFLMTGQVDVATEEGIWTITGPCSMISPPGTKRIVYAKEDTVWVTVHENPTDTQDIEELEKFIVAETYEELDMFQSKQIENKKTNLIL